ncbi:MAG: hypothetical protein JXD23_00790 [Spirochaetales bacterium]|nr:hypothetical protein [Spirochaetales bacterium]
MADVLSGLKFPTRRHERFLHHVFDYCVERRIGLGLRGSTACGMAGRFSDLDLCLSANANVDDLQRIACDMETPVMGFFTVNPKGILTVAYARGFCVEIGIRRTVAEEEHVRAIWLLPDGFLMGPAAELADVGSLYRPEFVIPGDGPRVLYKAVLKYLCGKRDAAAALLGELVRDRAVHNAAFAAEWKAIYDALVDNVPPDAAAEFQWLYTQLELSRR